jgi:single-stranded-DNA-specific exonuclease
MQAWLEPHRRAFAETLNRASQSEPIHVLFHNDADGLAAGALLARGITRAGRTVSARLVGRGENPWMDPVASELRTSPPGALIVTDLGVQREPVAPGVPTVLIDHHVPQGTPEGAVVISGYGLEPTPSSSLLAYQCIQALIEMDEFVWLAALGIIGDYGEKAPFAELAEAQRRHGAKVLREVTSLINAPRRSSTGDAQPAFELLMQVAGPEEILSGEHPQAAVLKAAREEVKRELDKGRRIAPRFAGPVALIEMSSPCQIHPLVAQSWTGRLRNQVVIAANSGFREGYVHFAARTASGRNLIAFLREHAPPGVESSTYGQGHEQASGGSLPVESWETLRRSLGFV